MWDVVKRVDERISRTRGPPTGYERETLIGFPMWDQSWVFSAAVLGIVTVSL